MTASEGKIPEPDLSNQTLDRYRLLRRIGVGGMGAVYEAEHTRLRKRFAVKLLRYEFARNELSRKRFLREARAASAVTHPNVVAISDFGETDDGHVFFVMDLLAGHDLHDLLEAERLLPWPRAREILMQVTSALEAAHQQNIIHRDIKPSNVFLADVPGKGDDDFVKVLDFGIAKLSGNVGEATAQLTSTDEIFGTVAYMAPEMAMGTSDDPRSDIYAVGVMMFRMLTGELPFCEGNAFQILSQHIHGPIPSLRQKQPSIPETVEAIVLKAMAKQPEQRFASMDEFGRALRRGMVEATEMLVGVQAALKVGLPKGPMDRPAAVDIDKTTPLPMHGVGAAATQEPGGGVAEGGSPDSGGDSGSVATGRGDSAAVPRVEMQTVVSTPIAVEPSGPLGAPAGGVGASLSGPMEVEASGSMAARQGEVEAVASGPVLGGGSGTVAVPKVMEPTEALQTGPTGRGVAGDAGLVAGDGQEAPRGALRRYGLPALVGLAVMGIAAFFTMKWQGDGSEIEGSTDAVAAGGAVTEEVPVGKRDRKEIEDPVVVAEAEAEPAPQEPQEPEPEPEDEAVEPEMPIESHAEPVEADVPKRATKRKPKPKATKPAPKPKTDQEVVARLKKRITGKCKGQGGGTVKVEGMISSAGRVESLLVTPPGGLGDCAKTVKAAKFDPKGGVRSMPRFSVEL